jgi:hypothetical protein
MRTLLPGFATLSEFLNGLHGDCGPTATLAALNAHNPTKWPLTAAALRALADEEIAEGFAEANGAQNIPSMDGYLTKIGVKHETVGYDAFRLDAFHAYLKANAGHKPVIVEWANAGALPGDEVGVHFHYSTCGGIDTGPKGDGVGGGYLWCDGDNRADDPNGVPRPPVLYTWPQIVAAQPIAYVTIEPYPAPAPIPVPVPAPPAQPLPPVQPLPLPPVLLTDAAKAEAWDEIVALVKGKIGA